MMAYIRLFTVLCTLPFLTGWLAKGQINEPRAKAVATDLVRKKMGFEASHQLRATRREEWEDELFRLQVKVKGQIAKAVYFFEITESGYFVLSPDEAVYVSSADGERIWTVAIPRKDESAYGLYGFSDGEAEFRRLVSNARLDVRSEADAETAALLFFNTVKDPRAQTFVFHARQLRHKVEDYFTSKLPEAKAESQASAWWRGFAAAKSTCQLGVKSTRTNDGYSASVTFLRSEDGGKLELARMELTVSNAGVCDLAGTKVVHRR